MKKEERNKIILERWEDGYCYFCKKKMGAEFYCFGCGKFICFDCENHTNPPAGKHKVSEHKGGKMELPKVTQRPILHIDETPDKDYVLRILRAYRENCNCRWADSTDGTGAENPLLKLMNKHCEQRAKLLDDAMAKLGGL